MKHIILIFLIIFTAAQSFGQPKAYLSAQYNKTIYDITPGNNPWGAGLGMQAFFNKKRFRPVAELTADIFLEDDKILALNPDGTIPETPYDIGGMINLFAGLSLHPSQNIYFSFMAGPSFIGGQTLFGIKPSVGIFFSKKQRWMAKLSGINIFNRGKTSQDFGSFGFSIGHKLF